MIDEIFVFDNAIHCYDLSDANLREDRADAEYSRDLLLAMGAGSRWAGYNDGSIEFKRRWTVEELYELVFVEAPTDIAMTPEYRKKLAAFGPEVVPELEKTGLRFDAGVDD